MNGRFLLIGTIVGAVVLFIWGAISHVAIPWWEPVMHEFTDSEDVVEMMEEKAPESGMYFATQGVFAAVRIRPGATAGEKLNMGPLLVRQFITDLATVFLLALLLLKTPARSAAAGAGLVGLAALAAGASQLIPEWNWYGFSAGFTAISFLDLIIGWTIVGLVLGALRGRMTAAGA